MKTILTLTLIFLFTVTTSLSLKAQWSQIGDDIDGENAEDRSGFSVSLNSDGSIVAIGATMNAGFNGDSAYSGQVRIYENITGSWLQMGNDIDGEAPNHTSGYSISLDSLGTTVAIGAHSSYSLSITGYVKVYEFVLGVWQQKGNKIIGDSIGENFGNTVSLSSDGNVVAIGGPNNNHMGDNAGHVKIYYYDSGDWHLKGSNIYAEDSYEGFGYSVSLSADGNIVAAGANFAGGSGEGTVRIFEYSGSNWIQLGSAIDGEYPDDESGASVSLNDEGNIIAIGAPFNCNQDTSGHVRVYEYNGGNWIQKGSDIDGESMYSASGSSVCLSSDGNILAVGAPYNGDSVDYSGNIRIYAYDSGTWNQKGADIDGEESMSAFGNVVCLNSDGNVVAIGAPFYSGSGSESGYVKVYSYTTGVTEIEREVISIYPNPTSGMIAIDVEDYEIIRVLNNYGQIIYESNDNGNIDIKEYPAGIYYINVVTDKQILTKKMIKQ